MKLKCNKNGDVISKPPWDCSALKRKRKNKDLAWKRFEDYPSAENLNIALKTQGDFEKLQSHKVLAYEAKITSIMKTNPKLFYRYLNSKRIVREIVSALKDKSGQLVDCPDGAANLLGDFFSSTFTHEPYGPLEEECYKIAPEVIGDMTITRECVKRLLLKVDQGKLWDLMGSILNF